MSTSPPRPPLPDRLLHAPFSWRGIFVVALLVLAAAGAAAYYSTQRLMAASEHVEHTYEVLQAIDRVLAEMRDVETGARGYLLTGDTAFLGRWEQAAPATLAAVDRLSALVVDSPEQRTRAGALGDVVREKLDEHAATVRDYQEGRRDAAYARVGSGTGRRLMDDLAGRSDEMRAAEQRLLDARATTLHDAKAASDRLVAATAISALFIVLAAGVVNTQMTRRSELLAREIRERVTAEREQQIARQRTAESEQKFRTLADTMPQIVWSTRADGYHDYFNERWYEYTGMPRPNEPGGEYDPAGTGQGWNWKDYLHPDDVEPTAAIWQRSLATGEPYHVEYRFKRHDHVYRWFIGRALALHDESGVITRWFGTCTDVDDQKRAAEERERLLASERVARSDAEHAARVKDEFVAMLSHELRTPLNAILGWTSILKRDQTAAALEKGLDVIDRNARAQAQMVEDLLDSNRILSGKIRLDVQRVSLADVIEAAISSVEPTAQARGIRLVTVLGSTGPVTGDPARLQQVVWNLLTNALKFTPKGGRVHVTLQKSGSHVQIVVTDTGQGIASDFLPFVFERFRQADSSTTRRHGGLGLGLSIVRHLVEMHGGIVEAASPGPGQGATFTVHLPLAAATADREPAGSMPRASAMPPIDRDGLLSGVRVLIVDDEPDARELVERLLTESGAEVTAAGSSAEGLRAIQDGLQPDVIVSDIGMPDQDGYEFIRQVRAHEPTRVTPAAALTALARVEDRTRALLSGYQTHVAKPVEPAELVAVVASLAGRTGG